MMKHRDDLLLLIGRITFAALFIPDGYRKLFNFSRFVASIGRHDLPYPSLVAALAVVAELGGPILVLIGYEVWVGSVLVIAFCASANLLQHRYWEAAPTQQGPIILQFYKNIALMGGLLFLCVSGPGSWSLASRIPSISRYLLRKSASLPK